jgi:hypothetical protein
MATQILVRSLADGKFATSEALWTELFGHMSDAGPFLAPRWTATWVRIFGPSLRPELVAFCDHEHRPIGVCLLTARIRYGALLPHVRWHLNTDGEPDSDSVVIEHNRLLASVGREAEVHAALARHAGHSRVDELRVSGIDESAVAHLLQAFPGWRADVEWRESPFVRLDAVRALGGDHLAILTRNTRAQLRRSLARYAARGAVVVHAAGTAAEAESMLLELMTLHKARWVAKGMGGGFASPRRRALHTAFVREATPAGEAQLLRVTVAGETIAVLYNLVAHGKVNFYQSGIRYEADRHLRPGMVAHHLAVQHNLALGMAEYDFLTSAPGQDRYKVSLSTDVRRLGWVTLYAPGWRTRYFFAVRAIRDAVARKAPPEFQPSVGGEERESQFARAYHGRAP